jgi:site-specific recombinase XerD
VYHGRRHPSELGAPEVSAFLTDLAVRRRVSSSTQNQALAAILFLYTQVLGVELEPLADLVHARRPSRLPVVMTPEEVNLVLSRLRGVEHLMASLLYGAGLRLLECARLCVKDLDFGTKQLVVRRGKGQKDRMTVLPDSLIEPLQSHLAEAKLLHEADLAAGAGFVALPEALSLKYPGAAARK